MVKLESISGSCWLGNALFAVFLIATYLYDASLQQAHNQATADLKEQIENVTGYIHGVEQVQPVQASAAHHDTARWLEEDVQRSAGEVPEFMQDHLPEPRALTECCECTTTTTTWEWVLTDDTGCEFTPGPNNTNSTECIQTLNYGVGTYPNNVACEIHVHPNADFMISVEDFQVEFTYDYIVVDGFTYVSPPNYVPFPSAITPRGDGEAGTVIMWTSDFTVPGVGWKFCLRSSCQSITCEGGTRRRAGADLACSTTDCSAPADQETCCIPVCSVPDNLGPEYFLPEGCAPGGEYSTQDCQIGCAGGYELDPTGPLQTCGLDGNSTFSLPRCKESNGRPPVWNVYGDCMHYGQGCVASRGVGSPYLTEEFCLITPNLASSDSTTGDLTERYRAYFPHWSVEASDKLYFDVVSPIEFCQGTYTYCEDDPSVHGATLLINHGHQSLAPLGLPSEMSATNFLWTSDVNSNHGTGFLLCMKARCDAAACPSGYRFNCPSEHLWCDTHDCSSGEDIAKCCVVETQEDSDLYGFVMGQAAEVTWCYFTTTSTTSTTTTPWGAKPDVVVYMELELEPAPEGHNRSVSDLREPLQDALEKFIYSSTGHQILGEVRTHVNMTEDASSARLAFRVDQTTLLFDELSDQDYIVMINTETLVRNNESMVKAITKRITKSTLTTVKDMWNVRYYGSQCEDLYPCTAQSCWQESRHNWACSWQHTYKWCGDETTSGPGWGQPDYVFWLNEDSSSTNSNYGPEHTREVCCTCGGGRCMSGFFRVFDTVPTYCIPCQRGSYSIGAEEDQNPTECTLCELGRYQSFDESSGCYECPTGQYASTLGLSECLRCDAGSIAAELGQSSCDSCPPGTFANWQRDECRQCSAGRYAPENGTAECLACPAGRFSSSDGASECDLCDVGTHTGSAGRIVCDNCDRGTYADVAGLSACFTCAPGEAQSQTKQTACEKCDVGYYARQEGETQCLMCEPGTANNEAGASSCSRCDPGFVKAAGQMNCSACDPGLYAAEPGLTACRACDAGLHTDLPEAATGCLECQPGRFASSSGLTSCVDCQLGLYGGEEKMTSCIECDPGFFTNETGRLQCSQCEPGTYSSVPGEFVCQRCAPGYQAPAGAATQCDQCDAGAFASAEGTSTCDACSKGSYSPLPGSTSCLVCQSGRFGQVAGLSECPFCELGSFSNATGMTRCDRCSEAHPDGVPEYWITMREPTDQDPIRPSGIHPWVELKGAQTVEACGCRPGTQPRDGGCDECGEGMICFGMGVLEIEEGYAWDGDYSTWDCDHAIEDACPGGMPGRCASGRDSQAVACAVCLPDMVHQDDGTCVECKDADVLVPATALIFAIIFIVGLYYLFDSPKRKRPKLSFLLIVASLGQAVTIIQQLGIISLIRVDWTNPLLSVFNFISSIIFFDVEVLRPGCIANMDVVRKYLMRVLLVFVCLGLVCLAHLVSQLLQHRHDWRTRWPTLWCAIGTILLTFFVSILSTMLGPLQCKRHPNGRHTVSWYPSVVCWDGGDHTTMLVIGVLACLLPLCFLCVSLWAVREFPRSLLQADTAFLNRWAFLFFRYTPEAYWYGPVMMVRNGLVSATPVLTSAVLQILSLEVLMMLSMMLLLYVMPWRVPKANHLDSTGHFCLLMVTMMASFYVDEDNSKFISTMAVVLICALPVALLAVLCYGVFLLLKSMQRPFQFFLCHHKLGAGCFCRLLKLWLLKTSGVTRKVFIDSDDLKNLDKLFDVVAHQTETLVAVVSQNLLTRPWCIGEITTAHRSRIQTIPIYVAGVKPASADFITNFITYVPDISCLTQFSIDLEMIQEALRAFTSLPKGALPQEIHDDTLDALCSGLVAQKLPEDVLPSHPPKATARQEVVIVANKMDFEASATAMILRNLLNPIIQHKENSVAYVLGMDESVPSTIKRGMLICTNGVFTEHVVKILFSCKARSAVVLPIMSVTNFVFPSEAWMHEQQVFTRLPPDERVKAVQMVQAIFSEIAVDFQPSALSGTEATLRTKAQEIANRIFGGMISLSDKVVDLERSRSNIASKEVIRPVSGIQATSSTKVSQDQSVTLSNAMEVLAAEIELGTESGAASLTTAGEASASTKAGDGDDARTDDNYAGPVPWSPAQGKPPPS